MKFADTPHADAIRAARTSREAKTLGSTRSVAMRSDWERVKETVMKRALTAKFTQHPDLRATLLSTGERALAEHTVNDLYWGDGGAKGDGKSRLGQLLMEVRGELRVQQQQQRMPQQQ